MRQQRQRQRQLTRTPVGARTTGAGAVPSLLATNFMARLWSVVPSRFRRSCCLRCARRLDTGDGNTDETPSFTGRVWLAAASQLTKVSRLYARSCRDSLQCHVI